LTKAGRVLDERTPVGRRAQRRAEQWTIRDDGAGRDDERTRKRGPAGSSAKGFRGDRRWMLTADRC
jgi:hypothetical protein